MSSYGGTKMINETNLDLMKILKRRHFLKYGRILLEYAADLFNVVIMFVGVIGFNFKYIWLIAIITGVISLPQFLGLSSFKVKMQVPNPRILLNNFLLTSALLYLIDKLSIYVFSYFLAALSIVLLIYIMRGFLDKKDQHYKIQLRQFSTAVHEIGHYVANEEYNLYKSEKISLVPDSNSLGRLYVTGGGELNLDNYMSFLAAGALSSHYLLFEIDIDIDELKNILKMECSTHTDEIKKIIEDRLQDTPYLADIKYKTMALIKKQRQKILTLSSQIYDKQIVMCDELIFNK
jgi:hypothetical protein